jgi:hypothetical protein
MQHPCHLFKHSDTSSCPSAWSTHPENPGFPAPSLVPVKTQMTIKYI